MAIKYLKSGVVTGALNLSSIGPLLANIQLITTALTISNNTISMGGVTNQGALVVAGGVGIGGNLNIGQDFTALGNISAYNGTFANAVSVTGPITAYDVNLTGAFVADSGTFNLIEVEQISGGDTSLGNLVVINSTALNTLTAASATITNLTTTSISTGSITTPQVTTTTLRADTLLPRTGSQINLGNVGNVRITGGQSGYVLGTDGLGNLNWIVGPAGLAYANGVERVDNTVGLTTTGVVAGTYNRVTVDDRGRITSGQLRPDETLESVSARNSETAQQIIITNETESTSTETGALLVTGGVGVLGNISTSRLVAANVDVSDTLRILNSVQISRTLNLTSATSGFVPVKFSTASLVPSPLVGGIEFDGNYFYITTNVGRQVLQTRDSNAPITGTTNVRAAAKYNISISNPSQFISVNSVSTNAWDGVILSASDRILLANQNSAAENGIYVWQGEGVPLQRASDFTSLTGVYSGTIIFVTEGTLDANSIYQITTPNPITVDTTALTITQIFNRNLVGISNLAKDSSPGILVKTGYGSYSLRSLESTASWLTVSNSTGLGGNITIGATTIPVSAGGTGRTSIWGYMRGTGTSILSSNTIPLAHITGVGTMASQNANAVSITGGNITVTNVTTTNSTIDSASINNISANTVTVSGNVSAANVNTTGTVSANQLSGNTLSVSDITVSGSVSFPKLYGNVVQLGSNSTGSLSTNAVSVSTTNNVTDTLALMNVVLGKLVPPPPPAFPGGQTLSISGLTSARMANFTQTDNTDTGGKSVAGGTTVTKIRRANSYTTNSITTVGPGDTGTVSLYKNGSVSGSKEMVGGSNGTFTDLIISNNQDYHNVVSSVNPNFWFSFSASGSGSVTAGWNEVYITHSAGTATNTADWYYDSSSPGTPQFGSTSLTIETSSLSYSSTIPHYTSSTRFSLQATVNRLSGDTYPTSDTFITGSSGGAFDTPGSLTYSQASISTPLAQNLYVSSGSASIATTSNIKSGFGSSSSGPSLLCQNGYATGSATFSPGVTVLYKTGTSNQIEETSIPVNSVGTGSGNAVRILNPGSSDTPTYSASATAFNSQTSTLTATDATVVSATLKHDISDYSTGYLPVGPDLSSGRNGSQYFTFKFTRTVVSKFDIKYSGTIAGLWVALPGSSIDTASTLNGWLTLDTAYNGAGVPGAGTGGNGSNGAAVGGVAVLNSAQTNKRITATFGTVSSSSTATNEIYVRIKLTTGQTVTALSIEAASN